MLHTITKVAEDPFNSGIYSRRRPTMTGKNLGVSGAVVSLVVAIGQAMPSLKKIYS
jgi:hypothetical protein